MRFVGIDVAAERHVLAILGEDGAVLARPPPFGEDDLTVSHDASTRSTSQHAT